MHKTDVNTSRLLEARRLYHLREASRQQALLIGQLDRFQKVGIPVVLLKGSGFSGYLYPVHAPRTAGDIDVFVLPSDFKRVVDMVRQQGFLQHKAAGRAVSVAVSYERTYLSPEKEPLIIEIHRALDHRIIFPINPKGLMQDSCLHPELSEYDARILSVEDNLIHLALHGFHHLTLNSHGLMDAHELICQKNPNWNRLYQKACGYQAKTALFCLLKLISTYLDTPVQVDVYEKLRPQKWLETIIDEMYSIHPTQGTALFRITQLLGQLIVPDNKLRVLGFQHFYGLLRCLDFLEGRYSTFMKH